MNLRSKLVRSALALGIGATVATGVGVMTGTASADNKFFTVWANGNCDQATGDWVILWHLTNRSDKLATISDAVAQPADPSFVAPEQATPNVPVYAMQRMPGSTPVATLSFNATWHDGTTTPQSSAFDPIGTCEKAG
jgi:hypothetical protein